MINLLLFLLILPFRLLITVFLTCQLFFKIPAQHCKYSNEQHQNERRRNAFDLKINENVIDAQCNILTDEYGVFLH